MPLDTIGKKNRMDALTKEMDVLENDIKKLQKNFIFVDTTQPSSVWWMWNLRNYYNTALHSFSCSNSNTITKTHFPINNNPL